MMRDDRVILRVDLMRGILLTTSILTEKTAASKARVDVLAILQKAGYQTCPLPQKLNFSGLRKLWRELSAVATKDTHIVIEYPFKARFRLYAVYLMSRLKRIKLYGIIHDIGTLRKQTHSAKDMVVMYLFDGVIAHNALMSAWLRKRGYKKKIVHLELFDYLLNNNKNFAEPSLSGKLKIIYAGHLGYNKASFIYDKRFNRYQGVEISLYGQYLEKENMPGLRNEYNGVFNPHDPELKENYHFGLVWEGTSTDTCAGAIGEYTKYNNPHKCSLYIALGIPVIVWKNAAIAQFVIDNRIGVTIDKLDDLATLAGQLGPQAYERYKNNISVITEKARKGYFLNTALKKLTET